MARQISIIQGHPDPAGIHLLHAMADAYADGAVSAGHHVRRIEVSRLDFPLLRTQADFETGPLPAPLAQAQEDMRWAEHWVLVFPLWHGTMPALGLRQIKVRDARPWPDQQVNTFQLRFRAA